SQYDALNRQVTAATAEEYRDGEKRGILTTEQRQHVDALARPTFQPSPEVGIISDLRADTYAVLAGVVGRTEQAVFRTTILARAVPSRPSPPGTTTPRFRRSRNGSAAPAAAISTSTPVAPRTSPAARAPRCTTACSRWRGRAGPRSRSSTPS